MPSWLINPGKVLHKRHARQSKYEPLVEEVDLLEANPNYAHIRFDDGRETTVSLRDLAPRGTDVETNELPVLPASGMESTLIPDPVLLDDASGNTLPTGDTNPGLHPGAVPDLPQPLRRSDRIRKPVDRLDL